VDVALDHVVVHQAVDDVGTLALGGADDGRVEQQVPLVDEAVDADAFALAEVLERVVGVERVGANLELLAIAGGVEPVRGATIDLGQFEPVHEAEQGVVHLV
jgi:hypothetical protein